MGQGLIVEQRRARRYGNWPTSVGVPAELPHSLHAPLQLRPSPLRQMGWHRS